MAEIIHATPENIEQIVSLIAQNKLVVIPYGKKERRVFAIVGLANDDIVRRMKQIKQRGSSQGVAISGIPDVAPFVAELDKTPSLVKAAKKLNISPQEVIEKCFKIGGIGLVLLAQKWLPEGATMVNDQGQRTVLIAGENSDEDYDIFPKVYRQLMKYHKQVMVGTSANLHGDDTYHILEQDKALEKLKDHVDYFIYDNLKLGFLPFKHFTSATMIDLTGEKPEVIRWGNLHPYRFKKIFSNLIFEPGKLKHYKGRERQHHLIPKNLISFIKGLF